MTRFLTFSMSQLKFVQAQKNIGSKASLRHVVTTKEHENFTYTKGKCFEDKRSNLYISNMHPPPNVPSFGKFCSFFYEKIWENFRIFFVKIFISQNWKEKPCSPQKNLNNYFDLCHFPNYCKWSKKNTQCHLVWFTMGGRYPRGTIWLGRFEA
jgi:hypothetical protein